MSWWHPFAERQGFEPWIQLPVCRISSAVRSTTPASLLAKNVAKIALLTLCCAHFQKYS